MTTPNELETEHHVTKKQKLESKDTEEAESIQKLQEASFRAKCPHNSILMAKENSESARYAIQTAVALSTYQWNVFQQPLLLCCLTTKEAHTCFIDGFLCLGCVYIFCRNRRHLLEHRQLSNHILYFDMNCMRIYCADCNEYFASNFSTCVISSSSVFSLIHSRKAFINSEKLAISPITKRQQRWIPSEKEQKLIKKYAVNFNSNTLEYPGICGLLNLGNSCYMNAILQVLLHTHPLKHFFLSDSHRASCAFSQNVQDCAACALDELFMKSLAQSLESDLSNREALSPHYILEIIWRYCESLASYAQHDAHEFFITFVNTLRQHIMVNNTDDKGAGQVENNIQSTNSESNSKEIINHLFSGVLESHVYCGSCEHYSATLEDYFDISLDLKSDGEQHGKDIDANSVQQLTDCLGYLVSPEQLDNGNSKYCSHCGQSTAFYKRVAIQRLPQVLCFHLKRFQHGLDGKDISTKIESEIAFPVDDLDMSSYTSSRVYRQSSSGTKPEKVSLESEQSVNKSIDNLKKENENASEVLKNDWQSSSADDGNDSKYVYDLYAIVNHIGKIDHGHYITWIRENNVWFKCDDETVTVENLLSTEKTRMCSSPAYLLFYIAKDYNMLR
eukprot:jgi/Galph1/3737/GphlegSOOS_G2412.1